MVMALYAIPADLLEEIRSERFLASPYPTYGKIRDIAPVAWAQLSDEWGQWWITGYDAAAEALRDARFSKDYTSRISAEEQGPLDRSMLFQDPPAHTRLRALVNRSFTPATVERMAPRIQALTDRLIDRVVARGGGDFMADFALPLPITVIADLLGVPEEDRDGFHEWSARLIGASDPTQMSANDYEAASDAERSIGAYLAALVAERQKHPTADLTSQLIAAHESGDRLDASELLGMITLLLIAGHETTVNLLGNGLEALLTHPAEWARLRENPGLAPSAVEEVLRYDAPVQRSTFRWSPAETSFFGATIGAGASVSIVMGAANRDPTQFADPDRFDVGRTPNRHLAFGRGIHFCLGAPLARLEGQIAFETLSRRLRRLERTAPPEHRPNSAFRGLRRLMVAVRPS
jgi:cytochrome P450